MKWQEEKRRKLLCELRKFAGVEVRVAKGIKFSRWEEMLERHKAGEASVAWESLVWASCWHTIKAPSVLMLTAQCSKLLWNFGWGSSFLHATLKLLWGFWLTCLCSFSLPASHHQHFLSDRGCTAANFCYFTKWGFLFVCLFQWAKQKVLASSLCKCFRKMPPAPQVFPGTAIQSFVQGWLKEIQVSVVFLCLGFGFCLFLVFTLVALYLKFWLKAYHRGGQTPLRKALQSVQVAVRFLLMKGRGSPVAQGWKLFFCLFALFLKIRAVQFERTMC